MTIDRHPESLKSLIREHLAETNWAIHEVPYEAMSELENVPLEEIDAVLLAPARHFPREYMDRLVKCSLIQIWSSGYDKFNITDARDRQLRVANNHGSNAISVAEHAIFMMLGVSRRAPEMHDRVITGHWTGNDHGMSSYSLSGKTLGIVGLGNIGSLVASRAEALGMSIMFSDPGVIESPSPHWNKSSFDELLSAADYVTFHVHLTDDTRDLINQQNVGLLHKRPFLINVSRAELIEKRALLDGLEKGLIKGVAIDAHYDEPTAADDPLFAHRNVFFSPHVAGSTVDSYADTIKACLTNIVNTLDGQTPQGLVDPAAH